MNIGSFIRLFTAEDNVVKYAFSFCAILIIQFYFIRNLYEISDSYFVSPSDTAMIRASSRWGQLTNTDFPNTSAATSSHTYKKTEANRERTTIIKQNRDREEAKLAAKSVKLMVCSYLFQIPILEEGAKSLTY